MTESDSGSAAHAVIPRAIANPRARMRADTSTRRAMSNVAELHTRAARRRSHCHLLVAHGRAHPTCATSTGGVQSSRVHRLAIIAVTLAAACGSSGSGFAGDYEAVELTM